uniref:Cytochrome P450 n=1 Tax=Mycena chlorophos TaxID=658473 RepID=A0ABQ0L031_MYCCL|nr:cytochrome P450 [Mycena chlorophos]
MSDILSHLNAFADAYPALVRVVIAAVVARVVYARFFTVKGSLGRMRGPKYQSLLRGTPDRTIVSCTLEWQKIYGRTFKVHHHFLTPQLFTTDLTALHHVISRDDIYQKAAPIRWGLTQLLGRGLLALEGEEHARLRKIMSPAFSPSQIRLLVRLFFDKSLELVSFWSAIPSSPSSKEGWIETDVLKGLRGVTLDIIGLAGFGYDFRALQGGGQTTLGQAFYQMFQSPKARNVTPWTFLRARFPVLRLLFPQRRVNESRQAMERIGMELLQDAKNAYSDAENDSAGADGSAARRDLLSLLVQSNFAEDESARLADDVVVAQIPTFFTAGHETTSTAVSWALYALASHPDVQRTLRAELNTLGTDQPSFEALNALTYLDAVVREVMRLYSAVAFTNRVAVEDDVVPLAKGDEWVDQDGKVWDSILVKKGQMIYVPVAAVNRDREIWGEDADEFRPERWTSVPAGANAVPGVYSHLFTFLGGPHNCIGWRFSVAETKSLIFTLIRAFEFALPEGMTPDDVVRASNAAVQRPVLKGREKEGNQLPMRMRRVGE